MDDEALRAVESAYAALAAGDVEPLIALLHPNVEWRASSERPHDRPT